MKIRSQSVHRHRWRARGLAAFGKGLAFLIALAVSACDDFRTVAWLDEPSGRGTEQFAETAFDSRLVDGLEEYWARCIADMVIAAWDAGALDLSGRCDAADDEGAFDSLSPIGRTVHGAIAFAANSNPIVITLPSPLFEFDMDFSFDDWPIQNCEVSATTAVFFDSIRLRTLEASWVEKNDEPALRLILTTAHPNTIHVAHRTTNAEADCRSGTSERKVQRKLDKSGINGAGFIFVDELKITIHLTFRRNAERDRVEIDTDVNTSLEGIDVGINWDKLPSRAEESFDASIASLGSRVAAPIATHLASVGTLLEP